MSARRESSARALGRFIDSATSPFHACAEVAAALESAGFRRVDEREAWPRAPGRNYVVRSGSLVAWSVGDGCEPSSGFRIVGAHTDSPNLRIKPRPNTGAAGYRQLGVEVYGGVLQNSWLDRDLGLSGRVFLRGGVSRLVRFDRALMRIPQLAIHLDRDVNERGLVLDRQLHLAPVWGLGRPDERGLQKLIAAELEVDEAAVVSFDLMAHDVQPAALCGAGGEFLSAPRLDDLCSCWCGLQALLARLEASKSPGHVPVLCLFDHEEVGSTSLSGAAGPLLEDVLERVVLGLGLGLGREDYHRAIAASFCASADMAHATHPNYRERHEPDHQIALNAGPVIKINTNQRYASDGEGTALFQEACERAGVPFQKYAHRSNLACGTTIGPLTAAKLGLRTVDVGNSELAMHSIRELCGADDPDFMVRALTEFLS